MAVIILGSGCAPVTGSREFDPIPCNDGGGGGISFASGDADDFVITSTGVGNEVQGEQFLQFDGNTLVLEGDLNMIGGTITADSIANGVTTSVLNYNTGTGVFTYNSSGGGTVNFLRADGTWGVPVGTYVHPNHSGQVTSIADGATTLTISAITDQPALTSGLTSSDELLVNNGGVLNRMDISVIQAYMQGALSYGTVTSITAGNGMSFSAITSTGVVTMGTPSTVTPSSTNATTTTSHGHAVSGFVEIVGTPLNNQIGIWTGSTGIEGDTSLTWTGTAFRAQGTGRFDGVVDIYTTSDSPLRLHQTDAGGTPGTPEGGWNYIAFYDGDGDRQGYFGINASGSFIINSEVSGQSFYISNDTYITGTLDVSSLTGTGSRLLYATTGGLISAGNLSGNVTTTNSLVAALHISAITDQVALTSGLLSTDELLVNDGGSLARMDISVLETYMQNNLTLQSLTLGLNNQIPFMNAGGTDFEYESYLTWDGSTLDVDGYILTTSAIRFTDSATEIWEDGSTNLTFKDAISGTVTLADIVAGSTSFGSTLEIPYINPSGTDFLYTSDFTFDGTDTITIGDNTSGNYSEYQGDSSGVGIAEYREGILSSYRYIYSNTAVNNYREYIYRHGGTKGAIVAAPTDAAIYAQTYMVHDGTSAVVSGYYRAIVDGSIATNNFDVILEWALKEGSSAYTKILELNGNGLEYVASHATDQAANDRWIPDKGYVDAAVGAAGGVSASGTPVDNQIAVWTNASTIEGDASLTWDGSELWVDGVIELTSTLNFTDTNTQIWEDVSGNMTFKDTTGTVTLATLIGGAGGGTVTSIAAGVGMNFTTITTTGSIVMGTPTTLTPSTINQATGTTHEHAITGFADIDGTPAANYVGVWTSATEIEGTSSLTYNGSIFNVTGTFGSSAITGTGNRILYANSTGVIGDANLSGQVTTTNSLATTLTINAIIDQSALTSGLASTDELLLNDNGVLSRMDVSVIEAYMQSNLTFSSYTHPNHTGHVTSTGDGPTVVTVAAITGQAALTSGLTSTSELLVNFSSAIRRMDISVLQTYMQNNLSFSPMVYPGVGIALSTGSAWGTSIANNSTNWNTAYTHSQLTTGNPHVVLWTELSGARNTITLSGFDDDLVYNDYTHPNHSGHVTSTGDGATVVTVSAITGQAALISGLTSTSELLVNYSSAIRRMDISVLQTYMQNNLSFSVPMAYPGAGIALSTGSAWSTSITNNSANWNIAYGWGDHSGLYDTTGTAAGLISTHESTYNHANYNTAYAWGDHAGLYANLSHTHGNITNVGAIGSTANLPIITTTSGVLTVGSFGTGGNTFCEGDDTRLSDARTPTSHTLLSHTISGETLGHVLAADSATTYSIRQLLGSEINNDLGWVTSDTTYTFADGLTESGGTVDLGGSFSSAVYLSFTGGNPYRIRGTSGVSVSSEFQQDQSNVWMKSFADVGWIGTNGYATISVSSSNLVFGWMDASLNQSRFLITGSAMTMTDTVNSKGLVYAGDYSTAGEADDRWIPDYAAVKAYADSVAGSAYTFDSGLTEVAGNVDLGGVLSGNVEFTGGGIYDFDIGSSGSMVNEFRVYADDDIWIQFGTTMYLYGNAGSTLFQAGINDGGKTMTFNAAAMTVTDQDDSVGLIYAANYDANGVSDDDWIPSYRAVKAYADSVAGTGDVTKVGTPVNNQIGVWTGDGTLEGDSNLTWDASTLAISGDISMGTLDYIYLGSTANSIYYSSSLSSIIIDVNSNTSFRIGDVTTWLYGAFRHYNSAGTAYNFWNFSGINFSNQMTTTASASGAEFKITAGLSSSTTSTHTGGDVEVKGGAQTGAGGGDGGSIYIYGGSSVDGNRGEVYFGNGSSIATVQNDNTEVNLLAYDTTTGLITYRTVASLP